MDRVLHGIVNEHGGTIKVQSEVRKGTDFHVYFPLMDKTATPKPDNLPDAHPGGNERILLVDDEESVAYLEKQMLERLGYKVSTHIDSFKALETFRTNPDEFDLVLTDMTMPNMTGDQFYKELIKVRPNIPVILCTGFSARINPEKAGVIGVKGFLMKPVVRSEMAKMVRKVLDEAKGDV